MKTSPSADAVRQALTTAHALFKNVADGRNADYIPYLAGVPAQLFGIAAVLTNGTVLEVGDTHYEFAIESISKVFTLALVMEEIGPTELRRKVGAEPTGAPFNSIIAIELHGGKPLSPLVNAGAMATTSLVQAADADERWAKILAIHSRFAGRPLALNEQVYRSEAETNFHNRAIAWLLYSYGTLYSEPLAVCDVYTRQCSLAIHTVDLATMGATLAAGGVNPVTGEWVISRANVAPILAEMTMEGLYGASGDWLYTVGLPGKSGVSGGILAVAPGVGALAAFSPPLDPIGNSVRGQRAVQHIANRLGLNVLLP
jgi:glutaminase